MIDGISVKKVILHRDDDGFFAELVKFGEETFHEIKQTSYSKTPPGVIKAFHCHKEYWEMWCIINGRAKVVLYDGRKGSKTKGEKEVIHTGEDNMMVIAIPPGVAHGYRVLGDSPVGILYHAGKAYDTANPGIEHIPHDDPEINFDWNAKNS